MEGRNKKLTIKKKNTMQYCIHNLDSPLPPDYHYTLNASLLCLSTCDVIFSILARVIDKNANHRKLTWTCQTSSEPDETRVLEVDNELGAEK